MYKVFIQNIPVIFTDERSNKEMDAIKFFEGYDFINLHQNMSDLHPKGLEIIHSKPRKAWRAFKRNFKMIKAGGGLVKNEKDQLLFIFRLSKWDLPKGKLDVGETIKECAVREVEEECNLKNIQRHRKICNTYHTYTTSKNYMLKKSYWYNMSVNGNQKLIPQTKENITQAIWVNPKKVGKYLKNSYGAIIEVIDQAGYLNGRNKD